MAQSVYQTTSGVAVDPPDWRMTVLEDENGQPLVLAATRQRGSALEIALGPLLRTGPDLDGRALGVSLSSFLRPFCSAVPSPAGLAALDLATGREILRGAPTASGLRAFVWRLTASSLAVANRRSRF